MTYYGAKELARSFRTVRNNTIKIAEDIPEDKYGFRPAEGCRSVAETLAHIAIMSRVQEQIYFVEHRSTLVDFDFFGFMAKLQAEAKAPRTQAQILELLKVRSTRRRWRSHRKRSWRSRWSTPKAWSRG